MCVCIYICIYIQIHITHPPALIFHSNTHFTLISLPQHGTIWQHDPAGVGGRGALINETGTSLTDSNRECPGGAPFLCPR